MSSVPRVINTNLPALNSLEQFRANSLRLQASSDRLATGKQVSRSADNVSGYAIVQNFRSQTGRNEQVLKNIQDGQSMLDVADGTMAAITDAMQRMRELLVNMANDVNGPENRISMAKELRALAEEIDRQAEGSDFNGINLLDGTAVTAQIQIGINSAAGTNTLDLADALQSQRVADTGIVNGAVSGGFIADLDDLYDGTTTQLTSSDLIYQYMEDFDAALDQLTTQRATVGALQSRMELAVNTIEEQQVNLTRARSRIEDTDYAAESAEFAQAQILQQAAVSILSQSNNNARQVLELLNS